MAALELTRRQVLFAAAACGLVTATSCSPDGPKVAGAGRAGSAGTGPASTASGAAAAELPDGLLLARRFSFGPSADLVDLARGDGSAFFDNQLDAGLAEDPLVSALLASVVTGSNPDRGGKGGEPLDGRAARADARREAVMSVFSATIAGNAWSTGQLRRVMSDFWADHLHVSSKLAPELLFVPAYDRDVITAGALGRFDDLLVASARSTAMLVSLDNASSRADGGRTPNENYARELLELQTVGLAPGVDPAYDEDDVKAIAHVLSGWSIDRRTGGFEFRDEHHDLGPAADADVLGFRPSDTGERDGEDLLRHLAAHPSTARFVCWKLARRFVADEVTPDDPIVEVLADVYSRAETAIGPVLRELGSSTELRSSAGSKLRRPLDLISAMLRTSIEVPDPATWSATVPGLVLHLQRLGQLPYAWPAPDGYPEVAGAWTGAGAVIARWNAASAAAQGFRRLKVRPVVGSARGAELVRALTGTDGSRVLVEHLASGVDPVTARALVFASPEFQLR